MRAYAVSMRVRFSSLAWRVFLIGAMAGLTSCNWKPVARPVQPELILEGPTRVEMLLDLQTRYVLTSKNGSDEGEVPQRAYSIVDWKTGEHCDLPEEVVRFINPIYGPAGERKRSPLFLLPVAMQHEAVQQLGFIDEHCELRSQTEYGTVSNTMQSFALDDDGREVVLYGNGKGTVAMADPWHDERTEVAQNVRRFTFVQRSSAASAPQLLWLLEDNKLTQRTLEGELVVTLGEQITEFTQVLFGELRVAYVDEGNLFEAVGPDFNPTRIAESACNPSYRGNSLELFRPCGDRQLVRINVQTGEITDFDKGVFDSYTDTGFRFEQQRDAKGVVHQFVEPPGLARREIEPPFLGRPLILNPTHLAGLKDVVDDPDFDPDLDADAGDGPRKPQTRRTFVVRDLVANADAVVLKELDTDAGRERPIPITDFIPFNDNRTSSLLWMIQHDMHSTDDVEEHQVGTLSVFGELDLTLRTIGEGIPVRAPLGGTPTGVRGYSIETAIPFSEPLIVVIADAHPLASDPKLSRGKLEARLLSGELGSAIADDVTSYFLIASPLPGVLYGVEEGDEPGLWFAAL